ncbi:MAG: hypothetical protein NTX52_08155 [Planctomycetota bacterium]|nr:hypothetical protein [Planctomycetota bacterium]
MKRTFILVLWSLAVLLADGCQQPTKKAGVEVIIEGNGQFPEFLAGTWRADNEGWEFVFEPDGSISSAVISLGRIRIKPGEVTEVPMIKGGKGVFKPGEWTVHYNPSSRELTVKISLKDFRIQVEDNVLEGKVTDVFVGQISKGGNIWQADWTSFPDYIANTPENPNFKLVADPNYGVETPLTFEKVTKSN